MFKLVRKWWKYLTAKLTGDFNERADPKVQLEQAITEAQEQHRRLKDQAACRSKRSRFITLVQAATKSLTNFSLASALA